MDERLIGIHRIAGTHYGKFSTCGTIARPKVKYGSEETAIKSAVAMSAKFNKPLEAYPCVWCDEWHIGRTMTPEEYEIFGDIYDSVVNLRKSGISIEQS